MARRGSKSHCCSDIFNYLLRLRVGPEELEQRYKSREIDKFLEKDKHAFRKQVSRSIYYRCERLGKFPDSKKVSQFSPHFSCNHKRNFDCSNQSENSLYQPISTSQDSKIIRRSVKFHRIHLAKQKNQQNSQFLSGCYQI